MARIQKPDTKVFVVEFTEYERGYGQKHWNTEYYDNEEEARNRAADYNRKHNNLDYAPDWYVRAEYCGTMYR